MGGIAKEQDGTRFGVSIDIESDDNAIAEGGLLAEFGFEIGRVYLQALGCDDHIPAAALEIKIAFGVALSEVACMEPPLCIDGRSDFFLVPVTRGDVGTSNEDLAVFRQL